ncbi:MAG: dephospho-CoA kinase, partial [Muribaculaceae bacterium]|nr:dephospho-CoA kinase [Muribaculaceae bacterium]
MPLLIAITGGIGAGKSYVAGIIQSLGYKVYDCDSRAKILMNTDSQLQSELKNVFGNEVITDGTINKEYLASLVFTNKSLLQSLNSIVHPAVINDIKQWAAEHSQEKLLFIETAIPKESGIDKIVDAVIFVDADEELRIKRVMARNSIDYDAVKSRINSQTVSAN